MICRVCGLEVQHEEPDADLVAALDSGPVSYAYCASCGVRLDPQTNRCTNCGLPVTRRHLVSDALQTCPICKTQNRRGTGICGGCGAALLSDATTGRDLGGRTSGVGPTTLPDVPVSASDESGVRHQQTQQDSCEPQSAMVAEVETTTVSYTEILGSWTPVQDAPGDQQEPIADNSTNGGAASGGPADQGPIDQPVDEFKTTAMPAVDVSQTDLPPTGSLPTGSLGGSKPTSVFDPNDLPFAIPHAPEAPPPEEPVVSTGNPAATDGDWVVTAQHVPALQTQPVEPSASKEVAVPSGFSSFSSEIPAVASGETVGPTGPGSAPPSETAPPPDPATASHEATPPAAGDGSSAPAHPRQVPPEVAHYMAYMERQSAPASPLPPRAEPAHPERPRKSRLLPIAIVTGLLAIAILAGLGYVIWRFRERQKLGNVPVPQQPIATGSIETAPAATPQPSPSATVAPAAPPEGMVMVPAGTYTIGRDDGDPLAGPKHTATLSGFYIDKTEVTNTEYKRFVDATGHASPGTWRDHDFPEGKANYPVTDVTWQDAADYAAWAGKRLPTEAEWEAAARGREASLYPWGNKWQSDAANIGTSAITEVGKFPSGASPVGALDMIGNVWEWTSDEFKLYPGNTKRLGDLLTPGIVYRVIRGGAYDGSSKNDASYRGFVDATKPYPKTGFRCVRD